MKMGRSFDKVGKWVVLDDRGQFLGCANEHGDGKTDSLGNGSLDLAREGRWRRRGAVEHDVSTLEISLYIRISERSKDFSEGGHWYLVVLSEIDSPKQCDVFHVFSRPLASQARRIPGAVA